MTAVTTALQPGLWVILTTPFTPEGAVDLASLRRQVGFARSAGADGLVALGVFGEAANLTLAEQADVVAAVAQEAPDLPTVLGLAGRSTPVALEQARNALAVAAAGSR